jgi:hypothetical protein
MWKCALHKIDFPDPILYAHLTDTINGQIHVLLYILNDPDSPRFDVDKMPTAHPQNLARCREMSRRRRLLLRLVWLQVRYDAD